MRSRSSSSTQAMLRPISPTPPRNATRAGRRPGPLEEPGIYQRLLDPRPLLLRRRDERQPGGAGRKAEDPKRGLHRDGVSGDEQGVEQGRELLVDLAGRRDVATRDEVRQLPDAVAHQMGSDRYHADRPEAHVTEGGPVIARIDLEGGGRL